MRAIVIVPTYNERDNLDPLIRALLRTPDVDVLVVDDGSPDGTGQLADTIAAGSGGRVSVLHRTGTRGLGRSYVDGMRLAVQTDVTAICQMDADFSHNPADLPRLISQAASADLVIGSRYIPGGRIENWSRRRIVLSTFANRYVRAITRLETPGLHQRIPVLATGRAVAAAARPYRVQWLRVSSGDGMGSDCSRLPHRGSADHVRRAAPGGLEALLADHARIDAAAVAPRGTAGRPLTSLSRKSVRATIPCTRETCRYFSSARRELLFPAYNDGGTIASLVIRAVQVASRLTPDFEVIVVNDGSTDDTQEIADELARTYSQVRVVHHARNRGYGGALRTGFAASTKDLIAYTDGDAQYDPTELEVLWERLTPEVDVVTGYKISRSDPLHRVIIGRIYHHTVKLMFRLRVRDVDCDFRLMRREVFNRVRLERNTGVICLEMMRKIQDAGFHTWKCPYTTTTALTGVRSSSTSGACSGPASTS